MIRVVVGLVTIALLGGEAVPSHAPQPASLPRRHVVEIRAFMFQPPRTLAAPGDTIVWINRDVVPHRVTAVEGGVRSPALEEGASWELVLEAGTMGAYFCEFHPHMTGVVAARQMRPRTPY